MSLVAALYDNTGKPCVKRSRKLDTDNYPLETNLCDINDDDNEEDKTEQKNKTRSKARIIRSVCFNKGVDSEKHRELIMLFTSWRNERTDLIKQYSSYEQHYLQV